MKRNHFRLFAILIGLLVCVGAGYGVSHFWKFPTEGHWTEPAYAPPLAEVGDRVQVYLAKEPLLKQIEKQALVLKRDGAETPVAAGDVVASLNDYDRARFRTVPKMLGLAAAAGGGLVLLLIGLFTPLIAALKPPEIVDLHLEE